MDADRTAVEALQPLLSISITFIVLCTCFVSLRFFARLHVKAADLGLDDLLIGLGYIICIALCADGLVVRNLEVQGNPPANQPILEPRVLESTLKAIYAAEQLLYAGTALPKLSLLFLYLRIFDSRTIRTVTWILIGTTAITWAVWSFIALFLCQPISFYWDRSILGGHCINIDTFWRSIPPFNIATDICTMILPIPTIWGLEASRLKKFGVIVILMTGGVGLITACIRWAVYLEHSALSIQPSITEPMLGWAIIEACMYLIAACLPMMRPILVGLTPRWLAHRWTRDGSSAVYDQTATAVSSRRLSMPWHRSKRVTSFVRLGEQEGSIGMSPTGTEQKSPLPPKDVPLEQLGRIHKTVDVFVTQARVSGSSSERDLQITRHARTLSYAEGDAAQDF